MRQEFAKQLYKEMALNNDIWLITFDLGFGLFDKIRDDFPDRFINTGAAEQAGMDIAIGLALSGKKPVVYSITTFLLYRPFETIRTYINYEKIPVILVASGRDKDYAHDGISHWSEDIKYFLDGFPNITQFWPMDRTEIPDIVQSLIQTNSPSFLSLRR